MSQSRPSVVPLHCPAGCRALATDPRIGPVERATGRTWDDWLRFMDRIGAERLDHRAIALRVYRELDGTLEQVGWWAQPVTVAHEQHIGRRISGQRPDGTFQASVSRATGLGTAELVDRPVAGVRRPGRDRAGGRRRRRPADQRYRPADHLADEGPGRLLRRRHQ